MDIACSGTYGVTTVTAQAEWKIVGSYSVDTPLKMDSMAFSLEADNGLHLKSWNSDGTVELHTGLGSTANWKFSWKCDPAAGDGC